MKLVMGHGMLDIFTGAIALLGNLQPVMFVRIDECISFWSGMIEPIWANYSSKLKVIRSALPVSFTSEVVFDLEAISGTLEGLYSFKDWKVTTFT